MPSPTGSARAVGSCGRRRGAGVEQRRASPFVYSGVPAGRSLDELITPDWAGRSATTASGFRMIYYESVRGCPYRCNFCNYPFLFDDTVFRYKSARKMADDWAALRR